MTARIVLTTIAALAIALPAVAQEYVYGQYGDISTFTPTDMDTYYPGGQQGTITIEDDGTGSPVLRDISLHANYNADLNGVVTCCAGTTVDVVVDVKTNVSSLPITGTGSITTSISWGPVSGYSQTGSIFCTTFPGPTCPACSSCTAAGLAEGSPSPPLPLVSTVFNTDPTIFSSDGRTNVAQPIQTTDLNPLLNVTAHSQAKGYFTLIPTMPLVGLGVLGAAFIGVGAQVIRKRRS